MELDLLDRRILYELDLNARIPATTLAKKLKEGKEKVKFRIRRLLKEGYLKGFYTVFDTAKLGYFYYKIYLKLHDATPEVERKIITFISEIDNCAFLASCEGKYDLICLAMVKEPKEGAAFFFSLKKKFGKYLLEQNIHTVLKVHRFNQKFFYEGKEKKHLSYQDRMGTYALHEKDLNIANALARNARIEMADIAREMKVDSKVVRYRRKKLEDERIILGYVTAPNFSTLGYLFKQLNIRVKDPGCVAKMVSFFDKTNSCLFAVEQLGSYDLSVELHVKDEKAIRNIMKEFKETFVEEYHVYELLHIYKEHLVVWSPFNIRGIKQDGGC